MKSSRAKEISEAAHEAAVREVMTSPKPGLVDALGSGCHEDMDCALFLKSADAISPYWIKQAEPGFMGLSGREAIRRLKRTGIEMEKAMFEATGGINTHKGLIYLMSLLVYGAARCAADGRCLPLAAAGRAAEAAAGSVEAELAQLTAANISRKLTNGENLFVKHGVTGIRGEAERGFPSVTDTGVPAMKNALRRGASPNDAGIYALLGIMSVCEDSNVMHRGGYDYWKSRYLPAASDAFRIFDPTARDYRAVYELEKDFLSRRISPGGAADLLSCTYFLYLCESL